MTTNAAPLQLADPLDASETNRLHVDYVRGRSRATQCESRQPLRILTPACYTTCCGAFITNYGGGFVQGDSVDIEISCGREAKLFLTTQANTRVYKTDSDKMSTQSLSGLLSEDSLAVVFTDPLVPHRGSRFTQSQSWRLHPKASLVLVDWLSSGRSETGESFVYDTLNATVRIRRENRLIVSDRFSFNPSTQSPHTPGRFSHFTCQLNIYLVGPRTESIVTALKTSLSNQEAAPSRQHLPDRVDHGAVRPRVLYSISACASQAHVVRILAVQRSDVEALTKRLSTMLDTDTLLGIDPLTRRA